MDFFSSKNIPFFWIDIEETSGRLLRNSIGFYSDPLRTSTIYDKVETQQTELIPSFLALRSRFHRLPRLFLSSTFEPPLQKHLFQKKNHLSFPFRVLPRSRNCLSSVFSSSIFHFSPLLLSSLFPSYTFSAISSPLPPPYQVLRSKTQW